MEWFPDSETLSLWVVHHGAVALFTLLTLEIIALPIPGEALMILAGILMQKGDLSIATTAFAAFTGSLCGIHLSYALGHSIGHHLLVQYGSYVGITAAKLQKTHNWFCRFGKWTLIIGYYIPGVRHLTGFLSGATYLDYPNFARFAVIGAFIWITVFLSIGYFFSDYWMSMYHHITGP
jgi:membrane protein DedA with SNARE-associated domain